MCRCLAILLCKEDVGGAKVLDLDQPRSMRDEVDNGSQCVARGGTM